MKKMGGYVCDKCRRIIPVEQIYHYVSLKKLTRMHFCSARCLEKQVGKGQFKGD